MVELPGGVLDRLILDVLPALVVVLVAVEGLFVFGDEVQHVGPLVRYRKPDGRHGGGFGLAGVEPVDRGDDLAVVAVIQHVIEFIDPERSVPLERLSRFWVAQIPLRTVCDLAVLDANEVAVPVRGVRIVDQLGHVQGIAVRACGDEPTAYGAQGANERGYQQHRQRDPSFPIRALRELPGPAQDGRNKRRCSHDILPQSAGVEDIERRATPIPKIRTKSQNVVPGGLTRFQHGR